jgi:hypothetical protein
LQGDFIDQANANAEAGLQIRLHQTDGRLLRATHTKVAAARNTVRLIAHLSAGISV